jgi:hypothetical protein
LIDWSPAALLLITLAGVPDEPSPAEPVQFAQLLIREQILIRVPPRVRSVAGAPAAKAVEWKEGRGLKCVATNSIAGATLLSPNSFDLVLKDRSRIRAKLEKSCPALDYYYGFYIRRTEDGQVCADRDSIHSRIGGRCEIDRFRTLKAEVRD